METAIDEYQKLENHAFVTTNLLRRCARHPSDVVLYSTYVLYICDVHAMTVIGPYRLHGECWSFANWYYTCTIIL